jgi:TolB-like protein/DNA-binding winged helix-turn-helix (wHTH) protein
MDPSDFRLDDWVIRPQRSIVEREDKTVHVKPKSMAVLVCLAEANGEVVSRDEIFSAVWPGSIVSDDTLTQCVVEIRKAFDDTARDARFIETIPKKGFRLVPKVTSISTGSATIDTGPAANVDPKPWYSPRRGLAIAAAALVIIAITNYWMGFGERQSTLIIEDSKSIAVLPFLDLGAERDQEYFADGLSEDLINKLAQIRNLRVSGRTSSFYFRDKDEELAQIGRTLDVGHIVEGSVRRVEDQLRVTAQLVDTSNGFQLWSENYDRPIEDIFSIQDEIAESVATALSIKLGVGEIGGLIGGTANPAAYNEYHLAQSLYREFTPDSILTALEHFRLAIEIDPDYALAWERVADIYVSSLYAPNLNLPGDWRELSGEALEHATDLAPDSQSVIATTAYRHMHLNEWQEAARVLMRGENPAFSSNEILVRINAHLLGAVGRSLEAIPLMERARRLDPLSGTVSLYLVPEYIETRRYADADADLERIWKLNEYRQLFGWIGLGLGVSSRDPDLLEKWVGRFLEVNDNYGGAVHTAMLALLDQPDAALDWLRKNMGRNDQSVPASAISIWAGYHGDAELALEMLPDYTTPQALWYDSIAGIRQLDGFKEIVLEFGLVDYWREFGWAEYCQPVSEDDFECK